jgi:hypothetical protein
VCVISLTLITLSSGCAFLGRHLAETCKTRAYVRTDLQGYISQLFTPNSPVRLGVIPFSAAATVAGRGDELLGIGNQIATTVQQELLRTQLFPIIEMLNRQDWPGKKEDFFSGNFAALAYSRDAGYDLMLVGYLEPMDRIDTYRLHTKLVEVESGTTLWFGTTTAVTNRHDMWEVSSFVGLTDRRPDLIYTTELVSTVARCAVTEMVKDPEIE